MTKDVKKYLATFAKMVKTKGTVSSKVRTLNKFTTIRFTSISV